MSLCKICKPIIRTAKAKKIKPQFEFNKAESEFSITIPEDTLFPLSLTLGASVKIPSPKVLDLLVGSGAEEDDHDEPSDKKKGQFGFKVLSFS